MTLLLVLALGQDLFEKARESLRPQPPSPARREGLDYRLFPNVEKTGGFDPGAAAMDVKLVPDFSCGNFDFRASFQSVFDKDVREELLGTLIGRARSHLAGSAMVLACQMSPTVCDALKHYRISAQDFLRLQLDQCRALEQASGEPASRLQAGAMKDCLERAQARGLTLDQAMEECRTPEALPGLGGRRSETLRLVRDVGEALSLPPESRDLLSAFLNELELRPDGVAGQVKLRALEARYRRTREERARSLAAAVDAARRGPVDPKVIEGLAGPGAPFTPAELQRLAALDAPDRALAVGSVASALALARTDREAGDVLSALSSARALATEPALQELVDQEARRIDDELRRLRASFEMEHLVSETRRRAAGAAQEEMFERARRNTAPWRARDRQAAAVESTRNWSPACPSK